MDAVEGVNSTSRRPNTPQQRLYSIRFNHLLLITRSVLCERFRGFTFFSFMASQAKPHKLQNHTFVTF